MLTIQFNIIFRLHYHSNRLHTFSTYINLWLRSLSIDSQLLCWLTHSAVVVSLTHEPDTCPSTCSHNNTQTRHWQRVNCKFSELFQMHPGAQGTLCPQLLRHKENGAHSYPALQKVYWGQQNTPRLHRPTVAQNGMLVINLIIISMYIIVTKF